MIQPAAKRSRTTPRESVPAEREPSYLLECRPEILRNVYSFLLLKEALELRRTCHQLHGDNVDAFQYSYLVHAETLNNHGLPKSIISTYLMNQKRVQCNLANADQLRALLRNETLVPFALERFMTNLIHHSNTDNAEAVTVLLQDSRCRVFPSNLAGALIKDLRAMAEALRQDDRVKPYIQMCHEYAANIGRYSCANYPTDLSSVGVGGQHSSM